MDAITKQYRTFILDKVKPTHSEYKPVLKICTTDNSTNWLSITENELRQIIKILTN